MGTGLACEQRVECALDSKDRFGLVGKRFVVAVGEHTSIDFENEHIALRVKSTINTEILKAYRALNCVQRR